MNHRLPDLAVPAPFAPGVLTHTWPHSIILVMKPATPVTNLLRLAAAIAWLALPGVSLAQDVEPRRWTHLPVGMNVAGAGYLYTEADIFVDPVLLLDDVDLEMHTVAASYVRSFGLAGKTARFDVVVPWNDGHWKGLLDGVPAEARRVGPADPRFRLSVNLVGAPALKGKEFGKYRAEHTTSTIVGTALGVTVPLGEYDEDKLINLGGNRFVFRPQIGVVHNRAKWSYEGTASVFLFMENDDFFNGNRLEQDPLYALQVHVIRFFGKGLWVSLSGAFGWDGEYELNGVSQDDPKDKIISALSFGFPVGDTQGIKLAYLRSRTQEDVGYDSDGLAVAWSVRF